MTNADPMYQRCAGCSRLYRSDASSEAAAPDYWAGWLAGQDGVPESVPLSGAWSDAGGTLVFLSQAPIDAVRFQQTLTDFLNQVPGDFRPRLLWLRNPQAEIGVWDYDAISIAGSGEHSHTARGQDFKFADYSLQIPAQIGFVLKNEDPAACFVLASGSRWFSPEAEFAVADLTLPMAGTGLGAWQGALALQGTEPGDNLQALGVSLRYARLQPGSSDRIESVDLPILTQDAQSVALALALDPLLPLQPARTRLRFRNQPQLQSGWVTTLGHGIELQPQTAPAAGLEPAGLVFAPTPRRLTDPLTGLKYHLAPSGCFALTSNAPNEVRARLPIANDGTQEHLLLGLAATEYAALPSQGGSVAVFVPAQPALLQNAGDAEGDPLSANAQTSYATVIDPSQPTGMAYYAQPQESPLYSASGSATLLDFRPVRSGRLPQAAKNLAAGSLPAAVPVGAYRGLDDRWLARAAAIERAGLAPARRKAIPGDRAAAPSTSAATAAVTPPGLLADVDGDRYERVIIGNLPQSSTPSVAFGPISQDFQRALQSNQLFFVVADPTALGPQTDLNLELSRWRFKLGPEAWRKDAKSPTLLLFKFADRSLEELAADPASWGWQQAGRIPGAGGLDNTSKLLAKIFADAQQADAGSPYRRFYDDVVANRNWSGVLFLNASIDVGQLDPQLGFISAGVVLDRFYAHHVGFALTPYTLNAGNGSIEPGQTAAFALVDYQDRRDLNLTHSVDFAYKTLALTAVFRNAVLSGFSAEVELLCNRLFGTELTKLDPERGNNLVLAGSLQSVAGAPAYAFDLVGQNIYGSGSGALRQIEVANVGLQTERVDSDADALITRFALGGLLRFADNPDFDLFAWGDGTDGKPHHLRYGNLVVRMHSRRSGGGESQFEALEGDMSFDLQGSSPRPQSLIAKFPLTLTGIQAQTGEDGATPEQLGYASIAMPLDQSVLTAPWYGLVYTLQLGSLGALAGSAGLSVQLLSAWAPTSAEHEAGVYLGLRLPGLSDAGIRWPLQGVLSLGFRSFEMQRYLLPEATESAPEYGYLLRLHRLALSFLGFSVPPGNTDVVLFGNPKTGASGALGWYAAYAKDLPAKKPPGSHSEALRSGPRSDVARLRRLRGGSHTV